MIFIINHTIISKKDEFVKVKHGYKFIFRIIILMFIFLHIRNLLLLFLWKKFL